MNRNANNLFISLSSRAHTHTQFNFFPPLASIEAITIYIKKIILWASKKVKWIFKAPCLWRLILNIRDFLFNNISVRNFVFWYLYIFTKKRKIEIQALSLFLLSTSICYHNFNFIVGFPLILQLKFALFRY